MKKIFLLTFLLIILSTGCVEKEKENPLKAEWTLDETLKPAIAFERSVKNDSYGVFYKDTQITFDEFLTYIKTLETNKFTVDWRYSDTNNIKTLEQEYANKDKEESKFSDGYINLRMCNKVEKEEDSYCFFMQWVDKNLYNSLNKDNPTSYSFKLETEPVNILEEAKKEEVKKEDESKKEDETKKEETIKKEEIKKEETKQEETKQEDETKQEAPKEEQPKEDETKQEESKEEQPKEDETKQEEPKEEQPKEDETKDEEPKQEEPKEEAKEQEE